MVDDKVRILAEMKKIWRDRLMLLFVLPGVLYFILFRYLPLLGNIIAFEDYLPFLGFTDSPFVGFANFQSMFSDGAFWQATANTIIIAILQLMFYFPMPIILAMMLQGVISTKVRRMIQSVVYLPHFISWVIVVALWQQVLGGSGIFVHTLRDIGLPAINVMTEPGLFKGLVTTQLVWKETGYATIIFLAALLNIDASLYEAAVLALKEFRRCEFTEIFAGKTTKLGVEVRGPAESHEITVGQVESWLTSGAKSPAEQTTKSKLAELLRE